MEVMLSSARTVGRAVHARDMEAGPSAKDLERVAANFRQYLLGWGEMERREGDLDHYRSGLAAATFNGVVRVRTLDAIEQGVKTARARLAGVPWLWWAGPDSPIGTAEALTAHGGVSLAAMPLMTRRLDNLPDKGESVPGLRIETVKEPGRLRELVEVYSKSMRLAPGMGADLARIEAQRADNADIVRLAAVLDDQVVGTTTVINAHGISGIFIVHVAETHRRRGVGWALSAAALRVGRKRGTDLAALIASPAGEPMYRRIGFTAVSQYRLFSMST
ncbi:GNAT family N-acetyltransferase [Streptomyces sp. NPDC059717]|uniref:GNAT family N-acetyltransferase n=1 Tax=Streptomyces sp. NPDC059717 TaxID=3346922 RepID=UPI00367D6690